MKTFIYYSLFVLIIFSACRKSDSTNSPTPVNQSPVLVKMYELDTINSTPYDTISRISFSYDASGRITSTTLFNTTNIGDTFYYNTLNYIYQGDDTLATKTIYKSTYFLGTPDRTKDTTIYIYAGGKLVYDSSYSYFNGSYREFSVRRMTYTPDSVILLNTGYLSRAGSTPPPYYNVRSKLQLTTSNGLLTHQIDTSEFNSPGNHFFYDYFDDIIYLSAPNPLYIRTKPIPQDFTNNYLLPFYKMHNNDLPQLYSHRENFEHQWSYPSPVSASAYEDNIFTFRPDGYPLVNWKTIKYGLNPPKTTKWLYVYE